VDWQPFKQAADRHAEALRDIVEPIKHLSTRRIVAVLTVGD
jgi:hypothetical protein